jgi:uncharacterized protein YdaU (DUF1376 family)
MSGNLFWMPLYIRDYNEDTAHLSCEQDGAYGRLLRAMWIYGGVPDDAGALAKLCGVTRTYWIRRLQPAIKPLLLTLPDGRLSQKRLQKEREKAQKISEKRALSGQKSAKKLAKMGDTKVNENNGLVLAFDGSFVGANADANGQQLLVQYTLHNKKERKSTPQPPRSPGADGTRPAGAAGGRAESGSRKVHQLDPGFEAFWREYPKKAEMKLAKAAYREALKTGATPEQILDGVRHTVWPEYRFVVRAHNWLNDAQWMKAPAADMSDGRRIMSRMNLL